MRNQSHSFRFGIALEEGFARGTYEHAGLLMVGAVAADLARRRDFCCLRCRIRSELDVVSCVHRCFFHDLDREKPRRFSLTLIDRKSQKREMKVKISGRSLPKHEVEKTRRYKNSMCRARPDEQNTKHHLHLSCCTADPSRVSFSVVDTSMSCS